MNKKILMIAMVLALPLTAAAMPGADNGGHHGEKMERMFKELNLNEDQKTKMDALFKAQHEKYKAIHEETRARLKEILTPEQMTKMEEIKKRHHEQRQNMKAPEKQN